ncbi:MAG: phage tail tape measure protein [Desulfobulbales bacterium]|nr:phage tail tape measure protein [Desulfobulbales bacterium]
MADAQRTLEVIFAGTDRVSKTVKGISSSVDRFAGSVGDVTQPLADFTGNLLKLEGAIIAVGSAYAVYAFNAAKKFEGAQLDLQKVLGAGEGDVSQYSDLILELSNKYGISSTEVTRSAANFKQAGFDIEASFLLVASSLDTAVAGEMLAADSSEILISVLKGFKAPASEAARLVDSLNEVSNNYATSLQELAIGMGEIAPIANKMGFSFEETEGILVPVIEIFRSGSEAAQALKTGLLKLIDDSAPVKNALESIGVSQTDTNGALRSGKDILADVSTAFLTLDEDQKLFVTSQLVGIKQSARMVEVFDSLAYSQEITAVAMAAAGSAAEEVAIRLASAEVAVDRSKVAFENMSAAIGANFLPEITGVINGITALENSMQEVISSGGLEPLFEALRPQLENIAALLQTMAKNLPAAFEGIDFTRLVGSFGGLGSEIEKAFEAFVGPIDLTTVEGLQKVIQAVVDGIAVLTEFTGGIIKGFEPFLEQLAKIKDAFFGMDGGAADAAGKILGFATAINELVGPLQSALGAVSGIGTAMEIMAGVQVAKLVGSLTGGGGAVAALGAFSGAVAVGIIAGGAVGIWLDENSKYYHSFVNSIADFAAKTAGLLDFEEESNKIRSAGTNLTKEQIEAYRERNQVLKETPVEIETKLTTTDAGIDPEIQALLDNPAALEREIKISVAAAEAAQAKEDIAEIGAAVTYNAATGTWTNTLSVAPDLDAAKAAKVKDKIDKDFALKTLELDTAFDIASLEASAATAQEALKLKASVDIASLETTLKTIESLGDGLEAVFASTGDTISSLFGQFANMDLGSATIRKFIERLHNKEADAREEALKLQRILTEAQARYMDAKTEALNAGEAMISVTADGLEPELEAFMWRIIERVQIRAAAEQAEFLLGV